MTGTVFAIEPPAGASVARAAAGVCQLPTENADVWVILAAAGGLLCIVFAAGWIWETRRRVALGARNARLRRSRTFWVDQTIAASPCGPCFGTGWGSTAAACPSCHGAGYVLTPVAAARLEREVDL